MRYRHTFVVDALPDAVAAFHTQSRGLKATTPRFMPMRLDCAPDQMGDGEEMESTMWPGWPLLFAYRGWRTRRLLARGGR
ncbi:MAG: hypothetical protein JXA93_04080 [Anaerolineae bacterium]|nr:hypothetical protein [Anaerolineae bacterium]